MVEFESLDDQLLANLRPKELRTLRDKRGPKLDGSAASFAGITRTAYGLARLVTSMPALPADTRLVTM